MSALKRIFVWILILIPPITFYVLLARSIDGLPIGDDYGAILGFLLKLKQESGFQRFIEVFSHQHNEYRLMFENAIVASQFAILGHTDLLALKILGDLLIIPLFCVMYLIWRAFGRPADYTLMAFVPVSWLLFQLQYEGTLNYTMAGLEIIPATLFAVLTCYLASRESRVAFVASLFSLALCVGSNGNGLFMIPVGAILFLQRKEYRRLAAWCCTSASAAFVYFHGYNFLTPSAANAHSKGVIMALLQHLNVAYALAFVGNNAAILNPWPAVFFGVVLISVFILATHDRLFSRNPALYYSALFFFVTAAAVSGLRSSHGMPTALNSTYRLNSTALLVLLYLYLADKVYGIRLRPFLLKASVGVVAVLVLAFNVESDRGGDKVLLLKKYRAETSMSRWMRHEPRPSMTELIPDDLTAGRETVDSFWPDSFGTILPDCIREGIYKLPELPEVEQ